jgi:hypothetical protein
MLTRGVRSPLNGRSNCARVKKVTEALRVPANLDGAGLETFSHISRVTMKPAKRATRVVVVTSVMLSFVSFWRAAAIVLNDLGSSPFYVGGIAGQAVGHAAPWFILGVMLFSYAVRAVYIESCGMFTRGGAYRIVKEAMGGTLAKLSVSALMFDYSLTGPISGVSAGQYATRSSFASLIQMATLTSSLFECLTVSETSMRQTRHRCLIMTA